MKICMVCNAALPTADRKQWVENVNKYVQNSETQGT
jgi:hypothetical protein